MCIKALLKWKGKKQIMGSYLEEQIYQKMKNEQDAFLAELKTKSKNEIISHAQEITVFDIHAQIKLVGTKRTTRYGKCAVWVIGIFNYHIVE